MAALLHAPAARAECLGKLAFALRLDARADPDRSCPNACAVTRPALYRFIQAHVEGVDIARIDDPALAALVYYQHNGSKLNDYIVSGKEEGRVPSAERAAILNEIIRNIELAFDRHGAPLQLELELWQGARPAARRAVGDVVRRERFSSMSMSRASALRFLGGNNAVLYRIRIPAGTKVIDMNLVRPADTAHRHEREVLLRRGLNLEVMSSVPENELILDEEGNDIGNLSFTLQELKIVGGRPDAGPLGAPGRVERPSYANPAPPRGALRPVSRSHPDHDGGWYADEAGDSWYLKPDLHVPELQSAAQVITSGIYQELGYLAPTTHIVTFQGRRYSASRQINGGTPDRDLAGLDTTELRQLRFFVAYLADFDRFGHSQAPNNLKFNDCTFALFDFGGSLGSHATGSSKGVPQGEREYSRSIGYFPSSLSFAKMYGEPRVRPGHPWNSVTRADAQAAIRKLRSLTREKLARIVRAAQYASAFDRGYMESALEARRDEMIRGLEAHFPP